MRVSANVPLVQEVGGYVAARRAMDLLGITSMSWLHAMVERGDIQAVKLDERTLLYDKASISKYLVNRPRQARRPRKSAAPAELPGAPD